MKKIIRLVFAVVLFSACESSGAAFQPDDDADINEYADGEYCAEVNYYNPRTGTSSTYTLSVSVEHDQLTTIHFPNGGWLDDSHFDPPDISDGTASITTDRGYEYEVEIIGDESDCN